MVQLRCQHKNEVIVITHAKYGRMREGRCMTSTYGVVGCSADVVHLLDVLCSGRRSCDVNVASLVDEQHQPCPLDFRSYLELSHKCVTGDFLTHLFFFTRKDQGEHITTRSLAITRFDHNVDGFIVPFFYKLFYLIVNMYCDRLLAKN